MDFHSILADFTFVYCEICGFQLNPQYLNLNSLNCNLSDCCLSPLLQEPKVHCHNARFRRERELFQWSVFVVYLYPFTFLLFGVLSNYLQYLLWNPYRFFRFLWYFCGFHSCILWNPWISIKSSIFVIFAI